MLSLLRLLASVHTFPQVCCQRPLPTAFDATKVTVDQLILSNGPYRKRKNTSRQPCKKSSAAAHLGLKVRTCEMHVIQTHSLYASHWIYTVQGKCYRDIRQHVVQGRHHNTLAVNRLNTIDTKWRQSSQYNPPRPVCG